MNTMSVSVVYLAFLSMPGIVGATVYRQLVRPRSMKTWQEFVEILLFAVFSYCSYLAICSVISFVLDSHIHVKVLDTLSKINKEEVVFPWAEIVLSSVISVALGFGAAFANNHKWMNRLGRTVRVTKRYGDEDVWDYLFNATDLPAWLFVKDHKLNLLYFGKVGVFSDSGRDRELILEDVDVYDIFSGKKLFHRAIMYLSKERFDLTIEIPSLDAGSTKKQNA